MTDAHPEKTWPGISWERITGCFLRAVDDSHPAGSTGGAWEVVQTVKQMPKHKHIVGSGNADAPDGIDFSAWCSVKNENSGPSGGRYYPVSVMSAGGDQPMPIVNKYTAVYMWRRTA